LPRQNEWVFNFRRKHLTDIRTGFLSACQKAGIRDFRFHDLRRCFVTRMRRKGIPDRVIMAITGHRTMECFRRCDSITEDDLKAAVSGPG
jgi:integrase